MVSATAQPQDLTVYTQPPHLVFSTHPQQCALTRAVHEVAACHVQGQSQTSSILNRHCLGKIKSDYRECTPLQSRAQSPISTWP